MSLLSRLFGKTSAPRELERFDKFLAALTIDGVQTLFVLLAQDGTVNRLGDGSVDCSDRDMFIGRSAEPLFTQFMVSVDPAIFAQAGSYDVPKKEGKVCELSLLFGLKNSDSSEGFQFRYGSDSQGPPKEIRELVIKAVGLTDGWHAKQKLLAKK